MSLPAHLALAIQNIGKLHDGPDVPRLAAELGKAYPQFASYYREAGPGTAWCGIFCAWCLTKSGVEVGGPRDGIGPMYVNWWLRYGTEVPVHQRQPGDLALWLGNPSPHHIAMVGDQDDYIGGNQADTVCRRNFRTPDAVRRPPAPGKKPALPSEPAKGKRQMDIVATVFAGSDDLNESAYSGQIIDGDMLGVSLPARFKGKRPKVRVFANGRSVVAEIVDVGPWNIRDAYWEAGSRPLVETQFPAKTKAQNGRVPTNTAAIDLTPGTARALGIPGKGKVDWEFVGDELQPKPASGGWLNAVLGVIAAIFKRK